MTEPASDDFGPRAEGRVGTTLRGKYRLDRVLGVGGMAVVYKATHRNDAQFAVKMLHPELSLRQDIRTRFLREGKAANSVRHPGVVMVVDDDVAEDGAAFLVMELLDGAGVEVLWKESGYRLPLRAALSIGVQLLDVLAAAHENGIVHRDIKPANLFATRDGTVKVLDFGIARVRDAAHSVAEGGNAATRTGVLLGTPSFMAPEQAFAKASEMDGQTDLWAVGATLFSLLSSEMVHAGDNAAQVMIRAATEHARPLRTIYPNVPDSVAAVVDRALAFEKARRWPTAAAMRDAIEQASLAAFGEPTSKAAVSALIPGKRKDPSTLRSAEDERRSFGGKPTAVEDFVPRAPPPRVPWTTAQPVQQTQPEGFVPPPPKKGQALLRAVGIAGVAAMGVIGTLAAQRVSDVRGAPPKPPAAATSGDERPSSAAHPESSSTLPANEAKALPPEATANPLPPNAKSAPQAAVPPHPAAAVNVMPTTSRPAQPAVAAPTSPARTLAQGAPAPASPPLEGSSRPPAAQAPASTCVNGVTYFYDEYGKQHFRRCN